MLSLICGRGGWILAWVKFRSRVLTALDLLPSIATLASLNSSSRRHSTTKSRQAFRMASPLSFRKSTLAFEREEPRFNSLDIPLFGRSREFSPIDRED